MAVKKKPIREKPWFPMAVAICIGVAFYIALSRFTILWTALKTFIGYFRPVIISLVIAYIVNPLAKAFSRLFKGVKDESKRRSLSIVLAFIIVLSVLVFVLIILIPQLVESIQTFVSNLDGYIASVNEMLENWGVSKRTFDLRKIIRSSESLLSSLSNTIVNNFEGVLAGFASAGKDVVNWIISFILSVYLLVEKDRLLAAVKRLSVALFGEKRFEKVSSFLRQCDLICSRYIIFNLLDCFILGLVNGIIMMVFGMEYPGLISILVGVANLIPTFGPLVGAVIGAFVLLMFNPMHALIFLIITVVLQILDAYILRPRLFGNSLGVSGLLILVGVVVGGNMFGVIGILLSVPGVAILDLLYRNYFLPWLERRREQKQEQILEQMHDKE